MDVGLSPYSAEPELTMTASEEKRAALLKPRALSHIGIRVSDLARSIDYYRRVFGFQPFYDNHAGPDADRVVIGVIAGLAVELIKRAELGDIPMPQSVDPNAIGFAGITFSVDDVDEAFAALQAQDLANMDPPVTVAAGVRLVLFRDPDGNLLEVIDLKGPKSLAEMAGPG
jgi:catechol 2,3-dioxygenase-like lactoylglutathione lyase family enzyme